MVAGPAAGVFRNTQLELDVLDREGRLVESITQLQTYEKQLENTRVANAKALAEIDYNIATAAAARRPRDDPLLAKGDRHAERREQVHDELDLRSRACWPVQAETNQRQEALRLEQLPQIAAELANLQREPGGHPRQARRPDRARAGGRQADRAST